MSADTEQIQVAWTRGFEAGRAKEHAHMIREIERALREAGPQEDSMATDDDLPRVTGRIEAVQAMREMLGLDGTA